ncbi:mechanosensitive ion channel domain-containing protein [uncultured Lutibacter sp.]|uniref:mechanosensitive ion channel family protein n=1 Tax=uncultured Lutibacter sp. TaxID=437739 RepID=UPI002601B77A|nr:mechanosensitive ion channel domain-containing protein [uncultured Lutibacter sp.]
MEIIINIIDKIKDIFNYTLNLSSDIHISIKGILLILVILVFTSFLLKMIRKLMTNNLPNEDKVKFVTLFSYGKWFIYVVILLVTFQTIGVNVTAIFAASAALLVGIGLALQTLIQDIISGVFMIVDKSLHIGDVIEVEGRMGKVEEINLRTTRIITIDNRVLIVPNHLFLTNSLYNYTSNSEITRENVEVGVAYGSDLQLVKKILHQAVASHKDVLELPKPVVLFMDFGDSSLNFKVAFSVKDSFNARFPKSDIRFEIDRLFRENNIQIPFPQRDLHIFQDKK